MLSVLQEHTCCSVVCYESIYVL